MTNVVWLDWPAPSGVKACYTLRQKGHSRSPYDSFNLGTHVGDDSVAVHKNRQCLQDLMGSSDNSICWLTQVHSDRVVEASMDALNTRADASYCRKPGLAAVVMTADCLPVFFCDQQGSTVAVAHAGWKGLLEGILFKTLAHFTVTSQVMAYLGPAIGAAAYEVGDELRCAFTAKDKKYARYFAFSRKDFEGGDKWLCDLYGIAREQLATADLYNVYGGDRCTFREASDFFSYRRESVTGRMANMIWKTDE